MVVIINISERHEMDVENIIDVESVIRLCLNEVYKILIPIQFVFWVYLMLILAIVIRLSDGAGGKGGSLKSERALGKCKLFEGV